ncbi:MAG: hypothetical protein E6L09_01365 [Verrucomicrobia bacterium]|nr:MAG: hypothetical protein E6L09_01365 [Verrucomicrobiota bacterium]
MKLKLARRKKFRYKACDEPDMSALFKLSWQPCLNLKLIGGENLWPQKRRKKPAKKRSSRFPTLNCGRQVLT